jgi:hypothetical protein
MPVRLESPADHEAVRQVNLLAFANERTRQPDREITSQVSRAASRRVDLIVE